jgi:two-component system, cell cycle sensor histidine kinase and response regulator CckA
MQSVGTLAGGVAHEFNNLLAGIQGYAALALREQNLSATLREFLGFIVQLSDRAANLTRQLLAFARKPALSRQITDMEQLLTSTASLVKHTLNLDVRVEIVQREAAGEPLAALADSNQLQQVLVNLALNARDASVGRPAAPVEFRLRHRQLAVDLPAFPQSVLPGDYVILEVEDHGCGMPAEVHQQALDPFFTTKDVGQGTGLGLPVAFGIIVGHAGFLTIDTEVGVGTRARIYLPRLSKTAITAGDVSQGFEHAQVVEPETPANLHILVIDDETAVCDIIRRFLQIAGHRVTCVSSGKDALEALRLGPTVDLAVMDLMIPKEDGLENIQLLRQERPNLPILLCTGLVKTDEAGQLLEQGNISILRKPFRMNELWYAVNKTLGDAPVS